jgi:hypothetical protein
MYSEYLFLQQITALFSKDYVNKTPLLNVLSCLKLIKPGDYNGLDYQAAFKGINTLTTLKNVRI